MVYKSAIVTRHRLREYGVIVLLSTVFFLLRILLGVPMSINSVFWGVTVVIFAIYWEVLLWYDSLLEDKLPFNKDLGRRIFLQLIGGVLLASAARIFVLFFIEPNLSSDPRLALQFTSNTWFTITTWIMFILATVIINCFLFLKHFVVNWKESLIANERLSKRMRQAELDALRAQLNPHFIFNSLNSINRYVLHAKPEEASAYLVQFSKLVRLILENSRHSLITLKTELTALDLYLKLELERLDFGFSYHIKIDDSIDPEQVLVPPMLFQPFLENSIWHGILGHATHGIISIAVAKEGNQLLITIDDNGVGLTATKKKTAPIEKDSFGLQLIEERLKLLSIESNFNSLVTVAELKDDKGVVLGTRATIQVPALAKTDRVPVS